MTQKLFAFAKGKCCAESCDSPMFQEVLLAGHLYQNVLKVRLVGGIDSCHSSCIFTIGIVRGSIFGTFF